MLRHKLAMLAVIGVLAVAVWALVGCGSSSSGTGRIQISLVDAPFDADEINVDITSVQVHKSDGGWYTLKEYNPPLYVNLLDYSTGGTSLMLVDVPLGAGHYTMVRLMLSGADIVIGGQSYPVDLRNVSETGVKCNRQFTVESGQLMALILDFNAGRSFVNNPPGSDNYMLHPVMTMSPVNIATEVTGTVEFQDGSSNLLLLPEGIVINVYPQGHAGDEALLITSIALETDGTFRIAVLAQGTYDLQVLQGDTVVKTIEGVVITAPDTDLGTIIVVQ